MDDVTRKNTDTVVAYIKRTDAKIEELEKLVRTLTESVGALTNRQAALEQKVNLARAASMGNGPSVVG